MKKTVYYLLILLGVFLGKQASAQELVYEQDNGLSFSKGTINTDVLIQLIQEKQEELNQFLLSNLMVKSVMNPKGRAKFGDSKLDNFATVYTIYETMDELTVASDKRKFGTNTLEYLKELALVYGLSTLVNKEFKGNLSPRAESFFFKREGQSSIDRELNRDSIQFNLTMDIVLELCITDTLYIGYFPMFSKLANKENPDRDWYLNDSKYMKDPTSAQNSAMYQSAKAILDSIYQYVDLQKLEKSGPGMSVESLSPIINKALGSGSVITATLAGKGNNPVHVKDELTHVLHILLTDVEPSGIKNFQFSETEMAAVVKLANEMIDYFQSCGETNVAAVYLKAIIDNLSYKEKDTVNKQPASLSLNFESLLFTLNDQLVKPQNLYRTRYFQPFIQIGVNYAQFVGSNELSTNADGSLSKINSMTFASEKIGFKYKIINKAYTRSFAPGVVYKYYGNDWSWNRPQKMPLINEWFVGVHAGGLLYTLVNLNTQQDFNLPFTGVSMGIRSFNGLTFSASYNFPFTNRLAEQGGWQRNGFAMLSVDIPIIEYINALRKNK